MSFSTNPFSSKDMTNWSLTQEALNNDRSRNEELFEGRSISLDESSDEDSGPSAEIFMKYKKNFLSRQTKKRVGTVANLAHISLSSRSIKPASNVKVHSSLKRILFFWFCMH
ncbi:MAG: hypothetical protein ACRDAI_04640 [Candidatus Rhabdochlamydia sp.]